MIEQSLSELAAAIKELTAALQERGGFDEAAQDETEEAPVIVGAEPRPRRRRTKAEMAADAPRQALQQQSAAGATVTAPAAAPAAVTVTAPAVTYEALRDRMMALDQAKGREVCVALLQRFGCARLPDLKPERYPEFVAEIDAALADKVEPGAANLFG